MANVFDQFDPVQSAPAAANPFDQFDAAPAAAQPQAPVEVGRTAHQAATGFNRGISSTVLRGLDAIPYYADKAIGGEGVHPLESTFNKYFVDPAGEPRNNIERVASQGGSMAGQNLEMLVPSMGLAKAGVRTGAEMLPGIKNTLGRAADAVLEWMAKSPGKAVATDTAAAFGSGAGGETGRGMAEEAGAGPTGQALAETVGQIGTPALAATYAKFAPTKMAVQGAATLGKKAVQTIPDAVLPEAMRPSTGTTADRAAEKLAFSNREGKYADPNIPPPEEPNWLTRQQDIGANKRASDAAATVKDEMDQITRRPEAAENLSIADRLKKTIPGFEPGLAKETGDPALVNLQQRLESQATGGDLRSARERYDASAQAIRDKANSVAPSPTTQSKAAGLEKLPEPRDPGADSYNITDEKGAPLAALDVRSDGKNLEISWVGAHEDQATPNLGPAKVRSVVDALAKLYPEAQTLTGTRVGGARSPDGSAMPDVAIPLRARTGVPIENPQDVVASTAAQRVQGVNDHLAGQQEAVRARIQEESAALPDAERVDRGARFRDINDAAETASDARTTELRKKIAEPDAVVKIGEPQWNPKTGTFDNAETTTVNGLLDRRAAVSQELRKYQNASARTVADGEQMQKLQDERNALDQHINSVNNPGMKEYRDYYRDTHVPNFEEGAARDVAKYDRFGYDKNKVPDEKVLDKFGGPNNISAAQQFTRVHGNNPEAVQLMADHQLGRLKAEGLDANGALKEGAVDKFLTKNRELLDALPPGVREAVSAKNPDALYKRLAELEGRQRQVADTKVASILGKNPEKQIDAALNDWQVMRGLKSSVRGDAQGEAALARAVMDRAPDPMDAKAFGTWLDGHDRVLGQVLSPQHISDLKDVLKASQMQGQLPRPEGTAERPKSNLAKAGSLIGTPIKSLLQRFLAVAQGRVGKPYTAFDIGTRMVDSFTERETDAVWREALFNPKVAQTLAAAVKSSGATTAQLSRLHNHLLTVGLADATGNDKPPK